MRQRMFSLVERAQPGDRLGKAYDFFIMVVAFVSVTPLMFKVETPLLQAIDLVTVYILFADYIFRWITHDLKEKARLRESGAPGRKTNSAWAFVKYPFTPYALLVLVSLLPSLGLLGHGLRVIRLFRISVVFQYSENFRYIGRVFKKERKTLVSVLYIAIFYIFLSALIMFAYEPENFENFFEATYWATTALTTVGYGDVYPVSAVGKLISMVSSLFGIAVIALPAGIVTAGFVDEIGKSEEAKRQSAERRRAEKALGKQPLFHITGKVKRYAGVMLFSAALNIVLNLAAQYWRLPVWLDEAGTAFAALLLEPAAGLLVGLATNLFFAITEYGPSSLLYYAGSAAVALVAGAFLKKGGKLSAKRILPGILLAILLGTVLSAGLELWIGGAGVPPANLWERYFFDAATRAGLPYLPAFFAGHLVVKTFDTLACGVIVAVLYRVWPKKQNR